MRTVAAVLTIACSGCIVGPMLIGGAALTPAVAPMTIGGDDKGQGTAAIGYMMLGADHDADVDKGWGVGQRSTAFLRVKGALGLHMYGRTEVGAWGRDRIYGLTGLTVGPGVALGHAGYLGLDLGYEYGGYPQIGHLVPVRGTLAVHKGGLGAHVSVYAGWRFGIRDEWPAATVTHGPGWNAWGGEVMLSYANPEGISIGIGWDHQDDLHLVSLLLTAALDKH